MKRTLSGIASLVVVAALSAPAFAQAVGGEGSFHDFLSNHPRIRADLVRNPNQVNDPDYIRAHPQFNAFYSKHPEVRTELGNNAPGFMQREEWGFKHPEQYRHANQNWRYGAEEHKTDNYLDTHPEVEQRLERNPALANNPDFLKQHPNFANWERNHPGVEQHFQNHPRKFMRHEKDYEHNH